EFEPGKDEVIRTGQAGYLVSYGEMLYRALDAVERLRESGLDVGLINKPTLNLVDEEALQAYGGTGFVLVVESQNIKTGLGSRLGSWLLERGLTPKFATMGTTREGHGGLGEQVEYQNLETAAIMERVKGLI
ncbi:MAG: transketolase C-terminal domain-containing protein, partial [Desulfofustis sp.]